jgi:hypothetical protein
MVFLLFGCHVRRTEDNDIPLYMNGNTVIIARGWNPDRLSFLRQVVRRTMNFPV